MIASLLLCAALTALHGAEVPQARLCAAASAISAERGAWDPALLAALAYTESRYRLDVRNPSTGVCGPGQTKATERECRAIARGDARLGYRLMVRALDQSAAYCERRGDLSLTCALAGYASGPAGVRGRWFARPRLVLRQAARIRAAMPIGGAA